MDGEGVDRLSVESVLAGVEPYALHHGDCLPWLDTLPDACVDALICDPIYAEVDRSYGRLTEPEWEAFAHSLVRKSLRVLKLRGSAVFIIQPNSEYVGRMRAWAFRFMAWCADDLVRETNGRIGMVQDAWWWNFTQAPTIHCSRDYGLMRPSVKPCVWIGPTDCYRSQSDILWEESMYNVAERTSARAQRNTREFHTSGASMNERNIRGTAVERGGSLRSTCCHSITQATSTGRLLMGTARALPTISLRGGSGICVPKAASSATLAMARPRWDSQR